MEEIREYFDHCMHCGFGIYKEDVVLTLSVLERSFSISSLPKRVFNGSALDLAEIVADEKYSSYHRKCYTKLFITPYTWGIRGG